MHFMERIISNLDSFLYVAQARDISKCNEIYRSRTRNFIESGGEADPEARYNAFFFILKKL